MDTTALTHQIRRFQLAALDMDWAREAALALIDLRPADLHALQVGMVVCYARPFTTSYWLEPLGDEWLPGDPEGRQLHEQLIFLRDKWAAHTDEPSGRDVVKVEFGDAEVLAATWHQGLQPELVERTPSLCESQRRRFLDERDRLESEFHDWQASGQSRSRP